MMRRVPRARNDEAAIKGQSVAASVETIYLIHHSHTDIGYTHDQPIVWELHRRFIDAAIDECERTADRDSDDAFRWTVETTGVLLHWLQTASDRQIERFVRLARAGRIEVTAMLANITPLYDVDQLIESFAPLRTIRDDLGLTVRSAMNSDVNGENWPLVDVLLDLGIEGFTMAINTHFGGALVNQPCAFHWEGPSGRSILAWNGWSYGLARGLGIGRDADEFARTGWPAMRRWLTERDYPLPIVLLQIYDAFGDNGSADPGLPEFVRAWNARGVPPRLRIALPGEWWAAVRPYADRLPRWRGDWTDFWNFGCGSSAREQAINRASRSRLLAADAARSVLVGLGDAVDSERYRQVRERAVHAISFWDEHTWGADCSVTRPSNDDTLTQWIHKASYAHTGRSLTLLLARDGVAELARHVRRRPGDQMVVFNPLPWPQTIAGPVPDPARPRGRPADPTAARHYQDRTVATLRNPRILRPTTVPAFGYRVLGGDSFIDAEEQISQDLTIETVRFSVRFDPARGGIVSLVDRSLGRDLVDHTIGLPFFGFVHESIADRSVGAPRDLIWKPSTAQLRPERGWQPGWPAERRTDTRVLEHQVRKGPLGARVVQRLEAPGVENLVQEVFLPSYADWIECTGSWDLTLETHPEATYLAFPFAVEAPRAWIDLGGQACTPEEEQLPGACRDYFTVQRWVELANADWGVTVATPDAPMIQLGDFHFGDNQERFTLPRALLLGWVTNNYWSTNFRAHQPGKVSARYVIRPHAGPFEESTAHRFAAEAAVPPLVQHLLEDSAVVPRLAAGEGSFLRLPSEPVLTLHVKPSGDGRGLILRLLNASDQVVETAIGSGLLSIRQAVRCDLLEHPRERLAVSHGVAHLTLPGRGLACIRLETEG